jgi:hypothetical protein
MNECFIRAMAELESKHPELGTTKGLSDLLWSCMSSQNDWSKDLMTYDIPESLYYQLAGIPQSALPTFRRISTDVEGWVIDAPQQTQEGAKFFGNLRGALEAVSDDVDPMLEMKIMGYHKIRSNVQRWQKQRNISALSGTRTETLLGDSCGVVVVEDQLAVLPTDEPRISEAGREVAKLFCRVVINNAYRYDLARGRYEDDPKPEDVCGIGEVFELVSDVVSASIHDDSHTWEPCAEGGFVSAGPGAEDPDAIALFLTLNNGTHLDFTAWHKDQSRFPWRNQP